MREGVEASLAQYETGDFPPPPTCGGASAEMLARFRRGQLEPTVFAVASGRGVYRGPSLDQPGLPPAILASRAIRAEAYACCLAAAEGGGGGASGGGGGVEVREFLVYPGKRLEAYEPDVVAVPPSNSACGHSLTHAYGGSLWRARP